MKTNIKATGVTLTEDVRAYLDKCLLKVEKHIHGGSDVLAQVELERTMSHAAGEMFRGELTLSGEGHSLRAESEEQTIYAAIDVLENKAVAELRKEKGKKQHIFRRQAKRVKDLIRGWRS